MTSKGINVDYKVINKYWLLKQLKLPDDMREEISGYCFYDKDMIDIRNKKRICTDIIKCPLSSVRYADGHWVFFAYGWEKPIRATNCPDCGNYKFTLSSFSLNIWCNCYQNFDDYDNSYISIEDIENEEIEYRRYRDFRAIYSRHGS